MRSTVNELSNSIDLESTLIRAEILFKRFQRLVEAVDKKENFPKPRKQDAVTEAAPAEEVEPSSSTGATQNNKKGPASAQKKGKDAAQKKMPPAERVITPELRKLLSRNTEVLPRETVAKKGDGMPDR